MTQLEVGKPFPVMAGRGEGVIFTIDDSGAMLIYNFRRPTEKEIAAVKQDQPFEIRFLELDGIIWILSKCGSLEWTDAPYNPRASSLSVLPSFGESQGLGLMLLMTDASTAIIKSLRMIGLGTKFSKALIETTAKLRATPMDDYEVAASINNTMNRYSTSQLCQMAQYYFKLK